MFHFLLNPVVIVFLLGSVASGTPFIVKFIHRHAYEKVFREIQEHFIVSMATNHLPHLQKNDETIYDVLKKMARQNGIEVAETLPEPPPIDFLPIEVIKKIREEK